MTLSLWKKLQIDNRTADDIRDEIKTLAASYVPEWQYDEENPDIGTTLGMLYADQMEENIERYNQVMDLYHTEFVNLLDISLRSPRPANGVVEFHIGSDTVDGTYIPKGTKLLGSNPDAEEQLVFETQHGIFATGSDIASAFIVDGEDGIITPLKGSFDDPLIRMFPQLAGEEEVLEVPETELRAFRLFGEDESIARNAVFMFHRRVFDSEDNPLYIKVSGNDTLVSEIADGDFEFKWFDGESFRPFESVENEGNIFTVKYGEGSEPAKISDAYCIMLEAKKNIKANYQVSSVSFSSDSAPASVDYVTNGNTDMDVKKFAPFSDTLSVFSECYIGADCCFAKSGAEITLDFDVSYDAHEIDLNFEEKQEELKIIKRKPRSVVMNVPADCYAQEIEVSYFNGQGYKKISADMELAYLFSENEAAHVSVKFPCPEDWEELSVGAFTGRMLRIQLMKSDNCYMRPCIHHYPIISDMKVSYSYGENYLMPEALKLLVGTEEIDGTEKLYKGKGYSAFSRNRYTDDALYLGFSKPFVNGPISMMFEMEDGLSYDGIKCRFEYSGATGFKPLKVVDATDGFAHSGTVLFMPEADMKRTEIEGKKLYWLRIVRMESIRDENRKLLPVMKNIRMNVTDVMNINTLEPREIYLDDYTPGQGIRIGADNILDIEVWVNEYGFISKAEQLKLLEDHPENINIVTDSFGNQTACFVKWNEAESFVNAKDYRVYALDRVNGLIYFGDGIKTGMPCVYDNVTMIIKVRQCDGELGNLPADYISESLGNILYVDEIQNISKTYGGSNLESVDLALRRGAFMIQSGNRLISRDDYRNELMMFSDKIADVEVICEQMQTGQYDPLAVSCVVLLKEPLFNKGSFKNFAGIAKKHLLEKCEITVTEENLHIIEPTFVEISVDVWAETVNIDDSFETQIRIREILEDFLNPVTGNGGWKIGSLPKPSQIMLRLNNLKSMVMVKKTLIVAKYTDNTGTHEMDLSDVNVTPFMICTSGKHNVHVTI